jgi:hypothetical protein
MPACRYLEKLVEEIKHDMGQGRMTIVVTAARRWPCGPPTVGPVCSARPATPLDQTNPLAIRPELNLAPFPEQAAQRRVCSRFFAGQSFS